MNIRRILRGGALLALSGLLLGLPPAHADSKDGAVKMTPQQLDREVRKSAKKANEKYKGKTIELTGKVIRVARHFSGKAMVELRAANDYSGVLCFTADKEPWGSFARGQTVKVTGTVVSRELDARTGFTNVTLRGTDKTQVACQLIPAEKDSGAALKVGQTATVVGQFGFTYQGKVNLNTGMVLHDKK